MFNQWQVYLLCCLLLEEPEGVDRTLPSQIFERNPRRRFSKSTKSKSSAVEVSPALGPVHGGGHGHQFVESTSMSKSGALNFYDLLHGGSLAILLLFVDWGIVQN